MDYDPSKPELLKDEIYTIPFSVYLRWCLWPGLPIGLAVVLFLGGDQSVFNKSVLFIGGTGSYALINSFGKSVHNNEVRRRLKDEILMHDYKKTKR